MVPRAASSDPELRGLCLEALSELLGAADSVGSSAVLRAALEAVQLLADLVRLKPGHSVSIFVIVCNLCSCIQPVCACTVAVVCVPGEVDCFCVG